MDKFNEDKCILISVLLKIALLIPFLIGKIILKK
jgi:hypothetical protein